MPTIWLFSYLVLWVFVVAQGVTIIALLRGFTGLHERLEVQQESQSVIQLAPGVVLADQQLIGLSGDTIVLSRLWRRGSLLLLFASADCIPCRSLLAWIGEAYSANRLSDWDVCVLCAGHRREVENLIEEVGLPPEIPVAEVEYATLRWRYQIFGTPTVAIVEENGYVVDVVAGDIEPYLDLLTRRAEFRLPA